MRGHRIAACALAALLLAGATPAMAQTDECEEDVLRGPVEFTPAVGAPNATLDAPIKIQYSADFFVENDFDPASALVLRDEEGTDVTGRVEVLRGDLLIFYPDELLEADTCYQGTAFGIDTDKPFNFCTDDRVDLEPPQLGEIVDFSSSKVKKEDAKCEAPEGGYRIDVVVEPADDDGPTASVEYLLYLTRGPQVREPELRDRQRGFTTDEITLAFVLAPSEAVSPICVQVQAVDGVGRIDDDGRPQCFDPVEGNFFEPLCSASPPGALERASGTTFGLFGLALGVLAWRRRARRAAR